MYEISVGRVAGNLGNSVFKSYWVIDVLFYYIHYLPTLNMGLCGDNNNNNLFQFM